MRGSIDHGRLSAYTQSTVGLLSARGINSTGRVLPLQGRSSGFESRVPHQRKPLRKQVSEGVFFWVGAWPLAASWYRSGLLE